jgi:predicted Zn-dependent protease
MKHLRAFVFGLTCFVFGVIVQTGLAQKKGHAFNAEVFQGKEPAAAATALLDTALKLAEDGSWERIAVGRAWYLGGDKAKGQQIFDAVTGAKKAKASDWFRVARVYVEAKEWTSAQAAFDKALALEPDDDSGMIEFGALLNVHGDRTRAEALFTKAMSKNPGDFWHWVGAGASYLGVPPQ